MKSLLWTVLLVPLLMGAPVVMAGSTVEGPADLGAPAQIPDGPGSTVNWDLVPSGGTLVYEALNAGSIFLPTGATSPIDGLPYVEYADDCHLTMGGPLSGFTIGYFAPDTVLVTVVVTLYANDAVDGVLGPVVAGPYTYTDLPSGFNVISLTPADTPILPDNVWFGVEFTPSTAGLVVTAPPSPTVGTSDDLFLDTGKTPPTGLVFFGGDPLANFMISIEVANSVQVVPSSWGRIKSLYK